MRSLVDEAGLSDRIEIDSAGTGDWHLGHSPDPRATVAAEARGIELAGAARQVEPADFERFDLIVAMDRINRAALEALAPGEQARGRIRLLREYADGAVDVPDPYYGGDDGFAEVLEIVDRSCRALLDEVATGLEQRS